MNYCSCTWERWYEPYQSEAAGERIVQRDPKCSVHSTAEVIIFKPTGKYYTS